MVDYDTDFRRLSYFSNLDGFRSMPVGSDSFNLGVAGFVVYSTNFRDL